MSVRVVNVGMFERSASGHRTTNGRKNTGDQGTVNVWYEGRQYTFGPGQSMVLEDGIASAVVAADGRLRVADTREGQPVGGAS